MGDESALLRRFRDTGDARAMEDLTARTRPRLLRIAARIGAPQDAEDSVQAAYHALLRTNPVPDDAFAWLVTTTVRIAYRRRAAARREAVLAERLSVERRAGGDAAERPASDERDARVRREVHRLPGKYRDAVILHHLEELPVADAARLLGVPEATVRTRTRRGRALLAIRLAPLLSHAAFALPWAAADAARAVATTLAGGATRTSFAATAPAAAGGALMNAKLVAAGALCLLAGAGIGAGVSMVVLGGAAPADPSGPGAERAAPPLPASSGTSGSGGGGSDDGGADPAPRPLRAARQDPAPLDEAAVRRILRDEFARMVAEARGGVAVADGAAGDAPGARGTTATPAPQPRLDAAEAAVIGTALARLRRTIIERDVVYEFDAKTFPRRPDAARMERYPDERSWPKRVLGHLETDPAKYRAGASDGSGYPGSGAHLFPSVFTGKLYADGYASLAFAAGVAPSAIVTLSSYGSVQCDGSLDGKLFLESYATVVARGAVTGTIETKSYANLVVDGMFSGTFRTTSSCNAYLLGGFSGALDLGSNRSMVHIAGFTPQSALERVTGKAGLVVLDASDLGTGTHRIGNVEVRVGVGD